MPRRIFGPNWGEVTGKWGKVRIGEFCVLCCSPDIIWMIKSRRMRWAGHVACMGEGRVAYRVLIGRRRRSWR